MDDDQANPPVSENTHTKITQGSLARILLFFNKIDYLNITILAVGLTLAIAIRLNLLDYKSLDYFAGFKTWYNMIKSMGFSAFAYSFADYNPPYLYLLYLIIRLDPDLPPVVSIKIPGLMADFLCAFFVFRLVQLQSPKGSIAYIAGIAVLFTPTVVLNSAFWGQNDSIYTAALLACLYYLMTEKKSAAMFAYGVALSFKLQAIFLAPLVLALLLRLMIRWRHLLVIPLILLVVLIPSWVAGRPLNDLAAIYMAQSSEFESITMNAPSIYTWFPQTKLIFDLFYLPGIILAASVAFLFVVLVYKSRSNIARAQLLALSLLSMMIIPFFLPKMHERYFYAADVLSIAYAFFNPQYFYFPLFMCTISFLAYEPYLFNIEPVPFSILTLGTLLLIVILTRQVIDDLYASQTE